MQTGFVPFAEVKRAVSLDVVLAHYELLGGNGWKLSQGNVQEVSHPQLGVER